MDISPQRVRTAEFKTVKRGLDPDEVRAFLTDVATELERAQNQSTAMEARARAAVARLQELSDGAAAAPVATSEPSSADRAPAEAPASTEVRPSVDEAETISRTLLLAQRTADMTVAEAKADAERIAREATEEASRTLDSTREMSVRLLDEARDEARRAGDSERSAVRTEVESLKARRDFLESDVDHLERHLADERSRLREAATTLLDLTERVPGGMGEVRRPLLSAADDSAASGGTSVGGPTSVVDDAAAQGSTDPGAASRESDDQDRDRSDVATAASPVGRSDADPDADDPDGLFILTDADATGEIAGAPVTDEDEEVIRFGD
ncbi:MAG: DivIVA domain-containing protein [Ilumatobacter sp.]|uniref:DivIVA domain-containing protein n=1 Tax=Ilumatobacter sp. TaxID=1967498 RepID=UPI00329A792A